MLLSGVTFADQCSGLADMLQGCEFHQNLPDVLVPVLMEAPFGSACKENPSPCPDRGVAGRAAGLLPAVLAVNPRVN